MTSTDTDQLFRDLVDKDGSIFGGETFEYESETSIDDLPDDFNDLLEFLLDDFFELGYVHGVMLDGRKGLNIFLRWAVKQLEKI